MPDNTPFLFPGLSSEPSDLPSRIPHRRKLDILAKMSEDDFRDRVVRPLFMRRGLQFLKDTCGPDEAGKDALFLHVDPLGVKQIYAVQTKRGKVHHNRKASENVVTIITQLRTALEFDVVDIHHNLRMKPAIVVLCTSGEISNSANQHIDRQLMDPRIRIMDVNVIINDIDSLYPEFWAGVDAATFPYLRALQEHLVHASDSIAISELGISDKSYNPIADDTFIPLYLVQVQTKVIKSHGKNVVEPDIKQFTVDSLARNPASRILILGDGGSGKTTALRRIADQLAMRILNGDESAPIPVLIPATDLATSSKRLAEIAIDACTARTGGKSSGFTADHLNKGLVAVLIDAIDEVPKDERAVAFGRIADFNSSFKKCPTIITSRPYRDITAAPSLRAYEHYEITPISVRQAKKVIERLATGRSLSVEQAQETLRRLENIRGMDLNPLLVTIFAASSDLHKSDIPPNITEIFSKFSELMLGRWDQGKGMKHQHRTQVKDFLLRRLAFEMHKAGTTKYALSDAIDLFGRELANKGYAVDAAGITDEVVHRSGLLRSDGDVVEFRHHMLQEFFAGRGVPSAEFFSAVLANPWWRNPLVFFFGSKPEELGLLEKLASGVLQAKSGAAFDSAISVGLALQACYLGDVSSKSALLSWVVATMGISQESFAPTSEREARPLMAFIGAYLTGRDAVGCNLVVEVAKRSFDENLDEGMKFWSLAGLLEAGKLDEFTKYVEKFKPSNRQAIAALMMGCAVVAKLRITSAKDRDLAAKAQLALAKKIPDLCEELSKEFRTFLLEVRKGKISELSERDDSADAAAEGQA